MKDIQNKPIFLYLQCREIKNFSIKTVFWWSLHPTYHWFLPMLSYGLYAIRLGYERKRVLPSWKIRKFDISNVSPNISFEFELSKIRFTDIRVRLFD